MKCERTSIHYSEKEGWHIDVLPLNSKFGFIVKAPNPNDNWEDLDEWLNTLDKVFNIVVLD